MKNGVTNPAEKYVIGLPSAVSAAGGGYVSPEIIKKAMTCLQTRKQCQSYIPTQTYPTLGGYMTWDINWDAKNKYAFVNGL